MTTRTRSKQPRTLVGMVVSRKMQKTIVVRVDHMKWHPLYHKQMRTSRRYHVHDEHGSYHVGDMVRFVETRPLSRTKRWQALPKGKTV